MKSNEWFRVALFLFALFLVGCSQRETQTPTPSTSSTPPKTPSTALAGSNTCQDCHANFYKLWSTSWHGLAMQPYTTQLAKANLTPQEGDITIGKRKYRVEFGEGAGYVQELGPDGSRRFRIAHVMGGKNVYYFLTPMDRGRLQVLPLAYDVHKKAWYDMAASGVRHFPDRHDGTLDEALDWTDRMFAFNTTCFNCHVTELATNYDLPTDTYHTTWSEPGISCESCHGPGEEHVRVMTEAGNMHKVKDIKLIRAKDFTAGQTNDMCATCHAKMVPLSLNFLPGEKFFDHFDLITLEHADFYPDGRDLGENYTHTSWMMNQCAKSGKLDCNHCHTPSGRLRFEGEKSNQMCMPCHETLVKDPVAHGHHAAGSKGNECIACHMPMTRFAAMGRTDHSMRPPTPAATIAFKSPNACNLCHKDQDAAWADQWARKWYKDDYQAETIRRAELIDMARKQQWKRVSDILADLRKKDTDEIYKTSLVRLLRGCEASDKWPVLLEQLQDPSPLVRSSAASALGGRLTPDVVDALLVATGDPSRLVRIRTAISLAALPPQSLPNGQDRLRLEKANREFIEAMKARPDDWASHANLGNFYMEGRDFSTAVSCFKTAMKLEPRQIGPIVNASIAYNSLAQNDKAEQCLRRALKIDPDSAAAHLNLGMLLAEMNKMSDAKAAFRAAFKANPRSAQAAYNLGVLLAEDRAQESLDWCRQAAELGPDNPQYGYTYAFYLRRAGRLDQAIEAIRSVRERFPKHEDSAKFEQELLRELKSAEKKQLR